RSCRDPHARCPSWTCHDLVVLFSSRQTAEPAAAFHDDVQAVPERIVVQVPCHARDESLLQVELVVLPDACGLAQARVCASRRPVQPPRASSSPPALAWAAFAKRGWSARSQRACAFWRTPA